MKKKRIIMLCCLLGILVMFGVAYYLNKKFNQKEHTLEFNNRIIGKNVVEDGNISVRICPRGYDTGEMASWYHTMDNDSPDNHYVGTIYELTITNLSKNNISEWSAYIEFPEELYFAEGWNGTFEMHQNVALDEKVSTFADSKIIKDTKELDYVVSNGVLLMPMQEGDYFRYIPSEVSAEMPISSSNVKNGEYSSKMIGFITYSKNVNLTYVIQFGRGNIVYKMQKSLLREPLFYVCCGLLWIWIMFFIIFLIVHMKVKKIEKENEVMEAMIHKFEVDDLTGVYSRQAFFHYGGLLLANDTKQYGIAIIDIDNYKMTHNQYGESVCNEFLIYLANYLKEKITDGYVGRFSRSKFAVIYEIDEDNPFDPETLIDDEMIENSNMPNQILKLGVYSPVDKQMTIRRCCDRVLLALMKISGIYGQNIMYFEEILESQLMDEHKIKENMEIALEKREFEVYYQPKNDAVTGKVVGAEALVRWVHPEYGFMCPGQFIPIFEDTGFITKLDAYVFERACDDICEMLNNNEEIVPISINMSRKDFYEDSWLEQRCAYVEKLGIDPKYIHLEITESLYAEDANKIKKQVGWIRDKGFKIEMDDFGSGYSSLGMLGTIALNVLKLDISFMKNIDSTEVIVESIINLAHRLGLSTIAEGVETEKQYLIVKNLGCDVIQGFFFSKPLPLDEFKNYIKQS